MMEPHMALRYRVGRLEVHARASAPHLCPECGTGPGVSIELKVIPGPVVSHIGENTAHEPKPSDWCPRCQRKLVFRIPPPVPARAGW